MLGVEVPVAEWAAEEGVDDEQIRERLVEASDKLMAEKAEAFGPENMFDPLLLLKAITRGLNPLRHPGPD